MKIEIGIAYHKPSLILDQQNFTPIHVGKELNPSLNLGIQNDNEGENISKENPYYCELTALYWLWKNSSADVKGLMHYRRIFDVSNHFSNNFIILLKFLNHKLRNRIIIPNNCYEEKDFKEVANKLNKQVPSLIKKYDLITTSKCAFNVSVKDFFSIIDSEYINILGRAVQETNLNFYDTLNNVLKKKSMYFANMTIMKSDLFDEYCQFLFSTLEKVKEILIEGKYIKSFDEKIFSRKLGYLGEILTNTFIWYKHNQKIKIKQYPVAFLV